MHGPNGTGRVRDKGRLIFPAFHFVPSLFYFSANCYRYPLRDRRWSPFPPSPPPPLCLSPGPRETVMQLEILSSLLGPAIRPQFLSKEPKARGHRRRSIFDIQLVFYSRPKEIKTKKTRRETKICNRISFYWDVNYVFWNYLKKFERYHRLVKEDCFAICCAACDGCFPEAPAAS